MTVVATLARAWTGNGNHGLATVATRIDAAAISWPTLTPFRCLAAGLLLVAIAVAAGANREDKVQRYGAVIGVRPEKLEYYKELHAKPWPAVNRAVKEANIRNYSIYLTQFDDGRWYLFSYFEYTGSDFDADMKKMGEDSEVKRWWKETDPCQIGLENRSEGEWWKTMEEVYHLD